MDKKYKHRQVEDKIYQMWKKGGYFTPKIPFRTSLPVRQAGNLPAHPAGGRPRTFSIIMPPPNANAQLHVGHAMFLTIEDILSRYHRMLGDAVLWLPGADHAGILTQVVFERHLEKQNKTRFDLGREEFYKQCYEFSQKNKKTMYNQMEKIGASCDWSRERFTLDPDISQTVLETFVRLYKDGLVYRDERMINWCPRCMTALANLEVEWEEKKEPLYYMKYGPFTLATVRPETKFGDTAVAVHPNDKRYQKWIGKEIEVEGLIGNFKLQVIADDAVDPEFGSGVVKVTPGHDWKDFEMGKRHKLVIKQAIGFDGKLTKLAGKYAGLRVKKARQIVAADLETKGLMAKVDPNYTHSVARCERCKTTIEPMISLQWFIKMKTLAKPAIDAVKKGAITILPKRFAKIYFQWMDNIEDWCVSRQIWWGHRMPVWYCGTKGLSDLQRLMNPQLAKDKQRGCGEVLIQQDMPAKCPQCANTDIIQEPDTFDTWFSSAQWPYTTLGFNWSGKHNQDFTYFYPTSVMETGYEILFFWVARMIMMGLYATGDVPFKTVYLHGLVRDALGEKMSKSKGNVLDPLDVIEKYGADALRFALIWGVAPGNDSKIGEEKIRGMRNFSNKLWNIGRFIKMQGKTTSGLKKTSGVKDVPTPDVERANTTPGVKRQTLSEPRNKLQQEDKKILSELNKLVKSTTSNLNSFQLSQAAEDIYHFIWHRFADEYVEYTKPYLNDKSSKAPPVQLETLNYVYATTLKLLHPFMPFVTEAIWSNLYPTEKPLIISRWPNKAKL